MLLKEGPLCIIQCFCLTYNSEKMLHKTTNISNATVITELLIHTANETGNVFAIQNFQSQSEHHSEGPRLSKCENAFILCVGCLFLFFANENASLVSVTDFSFPLPFVKLLAGDYV